MIQAVEPVLKRRSKTKPLNKKLCALRKKKANPDSIAEEEAYTKKVVWLKDHGEPTEDKIVSVDKSTDSSSSD